MPKIRICHDILQKDVDVHDGCRLDIIQHEVLKRMITVTGIPKLQCEAVEDHKHKGDWMYTVDIIAPTGVKLFSLWVRWIEDNVTYA